MNRTNFHTLSFLHAPGDVMTPRPATEAVVDRAVELIDGRAVRVADVGTGSGAIAVTLALLAPRATIWATDTSAAAVALARANADRHGVADRVHIVAGDLLGPIEGTFDVIVANLPYLPERLRTAPQYADLVGEPAASVFAAGDGLDPYRRLLAQSRERLAPGGALVLQFRGVVHEAAAPQLDLLAAELGRLAA